MLPDDDAVDPDGGPAGDERRVLRQRTPGSVQGGQGLHGLLPTGQTDNQPDSHQQAHSHSSQTGKASIATLRPVEFDCS